LDLEDKFAAFKVRWQAEHLSSKELSRRFAETVAIPEYQFNTNLVRICVSSVAKKSLRGSTTPIFTKSPQIISISFIIIM